MLRLSRFILLSLVCLPASLRGQELRFAGAIAGISTLSADGRSLITPASAEISLYKPENGSTIQILVGRHFNDYLSAQVNYGWGRNSLTLTSSRSSAGGPDFYEQSRSATQHALLGELQLYFRNLRSRFRPYLSVGTGWVWVESSEDSIGQTIGSAISAPKGFSSSRPALRVAVGIDIWVKDGWAFRFTFSETIRSNPISAQLTPPGRRNLARFENLFGFVKSF